MSLCAKNLRFGYGKEIIVDGWSIEIEPGEVVGLVGPSGAGKSTFAKLLAGYLQPQSGEITVDSKPLDLTGRTQVQLIIQNPESAVDPRWTAKAIIAEGAGKAGFDGVDPTLLKRFGVRDAWMTRTPNELSGGELQRLTIIRALAGNTRYLIADELSTMLDANAQAQVWTALLEETRKRSIGVLTISHNGPLLDRLCDRQITLEQLRTGVGV